MKYALLVPILARVFHRINTRKQSYIFTRQRPGRTFARMLLAQRDPAPRVIMEVLAGDPVSLPVDQLRRQYYPASAMNPGEWNAYWDGCVVATAIPVITHAAIPEPLCFDPVVYYGLKQFPQKFCYVPAPTWALGRPRTHEAPKQNELF